MKSKLIIASLLLVGACASMNAQEKDRYYSEKATDNIFVGAGIGGMAVINDGVNTPHLILMYHWVNSSLQYGLFVVK